MPDESPAMSIVRAVAEVAQLGPDRRQRRLPLGALDTQPEARVRDDVRDRPGGCVEQAVEGEQRARAAAAALLRLDR